MFYFLIVDDAGRPPKGRIHQSISLKITANQTTLRSHFTNWMNETY